MSQKVALITGASSGFGKEISLELARQGYYVFAAARNKALLEQIASENIEPVVLDVTQDDSVALCFRKVIESKAKIDLLVNNAGYGLFSPVEVASMEDIHYQFEVNVFGVVRMIQAALPLMRQARIGKIINISSVVGQIAIPVFGFYASTKHALEALSDALRMEVKPFGIQVVLIEPGVFNTHFRETFIQTLSVNAKNGVYAKLIKGVTGMLLTLYKQGSDPAEVAKLVAKIACSKAPKRRYTIGKEVGLFIALKRIFGYGLVDKLIMNKIE